MLRGSARADLGGDRRHYNADVLYESQRRGYENRIVIGRGGKISTLSTPSETLDQAPRWQFSRRGGAGKLFVRMTISAPR